MKFRFIIVAAFLLLPIWSFAEDCTDPKDTYNDYDEIVNKGNDIRPQYYVMSYSWAPDYCENKAKDKKPGGRDYLECGRDNKTYGYILHGLWPQGKKGENINPRACEGDQAKIDRKILEKYLCMTPSVWLLQHEFEYHGTCMHNEMFETPEMYFDIAKKINDMLKLPAKKIKDDKEGIDWLLLNNPDLKAEDIAYVDGEWHFCYGLDFQPTSCDVLKKTVETKAETAKDKDTAEQELPVYAKDEDCPVKGNINSAGEKFYFTKDNITYKRVKIELSKGEKCFKTEDEAKADGWVKFPY